MSVNNKPVLKALNKSISDIRSGLYDGLTKPLTYKDNTVSNVKQNGGKQH